MRRFDFDVYADEITVLFIGYFNLTFCVEGDTSQVLLLSPIQGSSSSSSFLGSGDLGRGVDSVSCVGVGMGSEIENGYTYIYLHNSIL